MQQMQVMWPCWVCLTWALLLILSITTYWSSDYGYHSVSTVWHYSGLSRFCQDDCKPLLSAATRQLTFSWCMAFHKGQSLAHFCSSCTRLTLHPSLPCTTFAFTPTPTTLNCTRSSRLLMVQRRPFNCCAISMTSTDGCAPTGWKLTPIKHSLFGLVHLDSFSKSALFSWLLTAFLCCFWKLSETSALPSTLSCRSSSTSTASYVAASINCDRYDQFDDPFQMTLYAPWYMRSSRLL